MRLALLILFFLGFAYTSSIDADQFGAKESGLRCYTGDMLTELRTHVASGKLKDLPDDVKALISTTDTLAVLFDYRKKEGDETEESLVVGVVKRRDSRVREFKTYAPEEQEFKQVRNIFFAIKEE